MASSMLDRNRAASSYIRADAAALGGADQPLVEVEVTFPPPA
jgi:hypothetical protein